MTSEEEKEANFLEHLNARSRQHLDNLSLGDLNEAYIALDLIRSILSAQQGGMNVEKVLGALPVTAWREDTVPIPVAFLSVLARGWADYLNEQKTPQGRSLGQCLGMEGKGQGVIGVARKTLTRDQQVRMSNGVVRFMLADRTPDRKPKQAAGIKHVADEMNVSETTVRNAFRRFGRQYLAAYEKAAKSSRG